MSEMVDRVAWALRNAPSRPGGYTEYETLARAAIEAMRKPTDVMEQASYAALCDRRNYDPWPKAECGGEIVSEIADTRVSWKAMIDAALK